MGGSTRTFGSATYVADNDEWHLEVEPHVAMKLKQVFGKIHKRAARVLSLSATEENCRDLEWFTQRYPLRIEGNAILEGRARAFDRTSHEAWSIIEGTYEAPPRATEMKMPPRAYQEQAALLCHTLGGLLLADDLGLGKTVSGIALLAQQNALPALVVVPTHLQVHWKEQCAKFVPGLKVHIAKTKKPYPLAKEGERPPDVLVCTYTKLSGWEAHVAGWAKTVIFDESQELRRGAVSAKYKAARNVAREASFRILLSATPIYNYGVEFWNVIDIARPGALGGIAEFVREWCTNSYDQAKARIQDPKAFGTYLREQGMMLRRTKKDVGRELPQITQIVEEVDSDAKVLDGAKDAASELARIILSRESSTTERWSAGGQFDTKLRQVTGLAKAPYVAEFVRMLVQENDEQVVVFGWHREVYSIWMDRLKAFNPVMFTGSESPTQKQKSLESFKSGESRVLLMSLRSGSGVDGLQQVSSSVVIGELDWSPGAIEQCVGRVWRDGQHDPVFVYYLTARDGADPVMIDVLGVKRGQIDPVRDPTQGAVVMRQADPDHVKKMAEAYMRRITK